MDTDEEIYNCFIAKNKGEAGTIVSRTRFADERLGECSHSGTTPRAPRRSEPS